MTSTHIRWILITVLAVMLGSCGVLLRLSAKLNAERVAAYSIHPEIFLGQRHRLKVGMNRADVRTLISRYDRLEKRELEDIYHLNSSQPNWPKTLPLRIHVWYDADGKVSKFLFADG